MGGHNFRYPLWNRSIPTNGIKYFQSKCVSAFIVVSHRNGVNVDLPHFRESESITQFFANETFNMDRIGKERFRKEKMWTFSMTHSDLLAINHRYMLAFKLFKKWESGDLSLAEEANDSPETIIVRIEGSSFCTCRLCVYEIHLHEPLPITRSRSTLNSWNWQMIKKAGPNNVMVVVDPQDRAAMVHFLRNIVDRVAWIQYQ
jgi:hypothetical protein